VAGRPDAAASGRLASFLGGPAETVERLIAEKCGLPLEHLRDFYQQLWFAHPAPKMYAEKLLKLDFAGRGGFVITGGLKDVRPRLSTAAEAGAKLEFGGGN
jgi:3-hydroxyisobutyrate dehydrogenase-like beta-hydroxyacid dehydrogenase